MTPVNLARCFEAFSDPWNPRVVADVNDMQVKVVRLRGEFVWHHHEREDELFLVIAGHLLIRICEAAGGKPPPYDPAETREVRIGPGELFVVPRGVEHQPVAEEECQVVLLEPRSTLNTGNVVNERTVASPERLA